MKRLVSLIAITAVSSGVATASDFKTACTRGSDERVIEVVSPGEEGAACDVRYFRGSNRFPTVPFHADNSENFCLQKANELVNTLATSGFDCALAQSEIVAEAQPLTPPEPEPEPITLVEEPDVAAAPVEVELEDKMNEILSLPTETAAIREDAISGPANLTDQTVDTLAADHPSPVVGRIVGATPDAPAVVAEVAPAAATSVTQTALRDAVVDAQSDTSPSPEPLAEPMLIKGPEPVTEPDVVASAPSAVKPAEKQIGSAPLRSTEDIVRATLRAQAAAWNEGNLDAFMETYWKDDGLKFVSGAEITKGWSATMKRYRERYGDGGSLGRLGLGQMDVELVTNDVAVVTGRFNHVKDQAAPSSGFYSLVMRQDRGVWRIVHDHTVVDAMPAE